MKKRFLPLALTLAMLLAFAPAAMPRAAASAADHPYTWGLEDFDGLEIEYGGINSWGLWVHPSDTAKIKDGKVILIPEDDYACLVINTGEEIKGENGARGVNSFMASPGLFYRVTMVVSSASETWVQFHPNSYDDDDGDGVGVGVGAESFAVTTTFQKGYGSMVFHFGGDADVTIHSLTVTEIDPIAPVIEDDAFVNVFIDHTDWSSVWVDDDSSFFNADNIAKRVLTKADVEAAEGFGGVASLDDSDRIGISIAVPSVAADGIAIAGIEYVIHKAEVTFGGKPSLDLTKYIETEGFGLITPVTAPWGAGNLFVEIDIADAIRTAGGGTLDAVLAGFETIEVEVEITGILKPRAGNRPSITAAGASFDPAVKGDIELKVDLGSGDYKADGVSSVSLHMGNEVWWWQTGILELGKDYTYDGDTITVKGDAVEFFDWDWNGEAMVRQDEPVEFNPWDLIYAVVVFDGDVQIRDTAALEIGGKPTGWSAESVNALIAEGLVPIQLQGKYAEKITRAEFFSLAVAVYETYMGEDITESAEFPDDEGIEDVRKMAGLGVVTGGGSGVDPHGTFSRAHAAVMFVKLLDVMGIELPKVETTFNDKASIASWALEQVGQAQAAGLVSGSGGNYNPGETFSRQEAMALMWKLWDWLQP